MDCVRKDNQAIFSEILGMEASADKVKGPDYAYIYRTLAEKHGLSVQDIHAIAIENTISGPC